MRVGFIGAGRAGCSFGKLIAETSEIPVSGYYSLTYNSALFAAELTGTSAYESAVDLIVESDVVFITVPDSAIGTVWSEVRDMPETREKVFCHMSGSLSSEVFDVKSSMLLDEDNRCFGSLHPMLAIADKELSWKNLGGACFTFEGNDEAYRRIKMLINALGIRTERINAEAKIMYHAACVFASNLVCALAYDAEMLLKNCGLSDEFAASAWKTLFEGNAKNIVSVGPIEALTGPAERGDMATLDAHRKSLQGSENLSETYETLTKTLLDMACEKVIV